jgi:phosphate transport system substrate-binding protein
MKRRIQQLILGCAAVAMTAPCYAASIKVEGSTTVLPLAQKAAEVYMDNNPGADISVRGGGSSVGIAALLDSTCDIADSSRAIKDTELDKAVANGVNAVAHVVCMDGIAVVVHPSNTLTALTKEQVKDIFTGKIRDWSQLGGTAGKIVAISRDTSSGTFEAFGELVLKGAKVRPDALMQASNQAVATTVARTPQGIGYVGLGFLSDAVKPLDIDGVTPSKDTVLSGAYPVSRPLFMYTNGDPTGLAKDFIDFVKGPEGQAIADELGYVGLK